MRLSSGSGVILSAVRILVNFLVLRRRVLARRKGLVFGVCILTSIVV